MVEIVKVYRQSVPAAKFIGKKYGDEDRVNGSFGACWEKWLGEGWEDIIDEAVGGKEAAKAFFEDGEACIGYMRCKEGEPFRYYIGRFVPPETKTPDGLEEIQLPAAELGVSWVKGKEPDIYGKEEKCVEELAKQGLKIKLDEQGAVWAFERYCCPRFFEQDEEGNVILDICYYVHPEENLA